MVWRHACILVIAVLFSSRFHGINVGLANFVSPNSRTLSAKSGSIASFSWLYKRNESDFLSKAEIYVISDGNTDLKYRFNFLGTDSSFGTDQYFKRVNFTKTLSSQEIKIDVVIQNVSEQDTGFYRCSVFLLNPNIIESQDVQLIVTEPPRFFSNESLKEIIITEGNALYEPCVTIAEPPMNVSWLRNGGVIKQGKVSSVLNFTSINRSHNGIYICLGVNEVATIKHTLSVVVLYPVGIKNLSLSSKKSFVGQTVIFHCTSCGNPKPTYHWITPNSRGSYSSSVKDVSGILRVHLKNSTDFGNYTCGVKNLISSAKRTISVTEIFPPGEVNLLASHVREDGFFLKWSPPENDGGSPVIDYVIKVSGSEKQTRFTSIFIKNLDKNTSYCTVCVQARNKVDKSKERCINVTTLDVAHEKTSSSHNTGVVVGSVLAGIVAVILLILLIWVIVKKRRAQKGKTATLKFSLTQKKRTSENIFIEENVGFEMNSKIITDTADGNYENVSANNSVQEENEWEITRENIIIEKVIGKGSFGQVAKGVLRYKSKEKVFKDQVVAVKMTKEGCSDSDKKDLLSELNIMKCLPQHENVIQLLGCVTTTEPLLVVIGFVPFGDLLGYLRKSRGKGDRYFNDADIKPKTNLTSKELIRFARDVTCGMEFLALNKVIHRDLAARNVLVGEELVCKITDFGMARDVYQDNIYTKTSKGRIPVKWTAYESLMYNKYTTQSDVWSYGILLYEIFTIGGTPYPGVKGRDVYSLLKEGYRIEKPRHVDKELYSVMLQCWNTEPEERPHFSSLKKIMDKLERKHHDYVNLKEYNPSEYENIEDFE